MSPSSKPEFGTMSTSEELEARSHETTSAGSFKPSKVIQGSTGKRIKEGPPLTAPLFRQPRVPRGSASTQRGSWALLPRTLSFLWAAMARCGGRRIMVAEGRRLSGLDLAVSVVKCT